MNPTLSLQVVDATHTGEARRHATAWAGARGCDPELTARLALVVTEMATNLAVHTREGGELLLQGLGEGAHAGIEILSLDRGPGVQNFGECLRDGHSTAGTAGNGLGAIQRASQLFDVHSQPGMGTALLSRLWSVPAPPPAAPGTPCLGSVNVPIPGEKTCGDQWAHTQSNAGPVRVLVADGLGHGELAARAARAAVALFLQNQGLSMRDLFARMHEALHGTRGAAVAVAEIDAAGGTVRYAGVGNIAACPLIREFAYPWPAQGLLVMSSDGIKTSWQLQRYRGLLERHPSLIAGVLYRDFARGRDDATAVVFRGGAP